MIRSTRGSAMSDRASVATGTLSRRARSRPGAQGFRSAMPSSVTVGSPVNISRSARPPFPPPTMTTLVMGRARRWLPRSERLRLSTRETLERRVLGDERDLHLAGGPVALLADDDVRDAVPVVRLEPIPLRPIEEQDHVGVLLERPGFAEIGQLRLLALSRLHRARQLGQGHDRDVQLLGERLERA